MIEFSFKTVFIFLLQISVFVNYSHTQDTEILVYKDADPNPTETVPIVIQLKCEALLPNCFCYKRRNFKGSQYFLGLDCKNMTKLKNFSQVLKSAGFSDHFSAFEITLRDTKYIPAGALKGLYVAILNLDDPHLTVDDNFLDGMKLLASFDVTQSSIKHIPDLRSVKDSLLVLSITSSLLTSLEGTNLQNLSKAIHLSFSKNSISYIEPDVFKGTENVDLLDLCDNRLTFIPPKLLDSMKNISKLALCGNNLQHVDNIFSVTHPRVIKLNFNNITDIDSLFPQTMERVESLLISGNPIKRISVHSFGKIPNVNNIILSQCKLQEFNPEHYKDLKKLVVLMLNDNAIENCGIKDQNGYNGIQAMYLDLSGNKLKTLYGLLSNSSIHTTKFNRNQIKHLTDKDFEGVTLLHIKLEENKMERIDFNTFQPIGDKLQSLDLSSNLIKTTNGSIRYLSQIQWLDLSHNSIETFAQDDFLGLEKLKKLHLQHNHIKTLEQLQHLHQLQYINISYNDISSISSDQLLHTFENMNVTGLKRLQVGYLILSVNKLQNLKSFLWYFEANRVYVDRNQIQYLTEENFKGTSENRLALISLTLQENKIQRIESNTFQPIRKDLEILDLSSNSIKTLNGSIKYLSLLQTLNLSYNSIETFEQDDFKGLNSLSKLYLQYNQLKTLDQLQNLLQLQSLYISHNDINSIPSQMPETLRHMNIADNPFKCDCRIQQFLLRLNTSDSPDTDTDLCLRSHFVYSLNYTNCPEMCSCGCTTNGKTSFMYVDCRSKNLHILPQFLENTFKQTDRLLIMNQNTYPWFHIEDRVLEINLENNSLGSIESFHFPKNLIHLSLANNKLRRLPDYIFDDLLNLTRVSLSENPWDCDCSALKFKNWLISKYLIIQDINNTRCGKNIHGLNGKVIWSLTDIEICPTRVQWIVSASIAVLIFMIFCLAVKVLYTKYELNIKVFFWSHGFTFVKEGDIDSNKRFDAFLSFSEKDGEFVALEIIKVIENKDPNIRLCIHYRDFRAGEFIEDNITYAVQNSKRTVLILSRNFLASEWCMMEFQAAHVQALNDKVHRIILIKLGDLPRDIHPQIKAYLDSTTYLTWGEKHFWNNLLYILPTSSNIRHPAPQNILETEI